MQKKNIKRFKMMESQDHKQLQIYNIPIDFHEVVLDFYNDPEFRLPYNEPSIYNLERFLKRYPEHLPQGRKNILDHVQRLPFTVAPVLFEKYKLHAEIFIN